MARKSVTIYVCDKCKKETQDDTKIVRMCREVGSYTDAAGGSDSKTASLDLCVDKCFIIVAMAFIRKVPDDEWIDIVKRNGGELFPRDRF